MTARGLVLVRRARTGDVEGLLRLQHDAFGEDPWCLTRQGFEAFCSRRGIVVLVAVEDREPVGYAILHSRPFRPWTSLDYIAVVSARRRSGIGRALMAAALPLVKRKSLRLFVRAANEAAIAFYELHGFERAGLRRGHYADGADALAMIRVMR
ncbi:MAG: GNAT family N-acetyltransferase [Oricola sp.]